MATLQRWVSLDITHADAPRNPPQSPESGAQTFISMAIVAVALLVQRASDPVLLRAIVVAIGCQQIIQIVTADYTPAVDLLYAKAIVGEHIEAGVGQATIQ